MEGAHTASTQEGRLYSQKRGCPLPVDLHKMIFFWQRLTIPNKTTTTTCSQCSSIRRIKNNSKWIKCALSSALHKPWAIVYRSKHCFVGKGLWSFSTTILLRVLLVAVSPSCLLHWLLKQPTTSGTLYVSGVTIQRSMDTYVQMSPHMATKQAGQKKRSSKQLTAEGQW